MTEAPQERRLRVLVVDDRRDSALLLHALLEHAGYEVATADSGEKGLGAFRQFKPDAIISDIALLGALDGYDLARAVKSESAVSPRFIAVTGHDDDDHRQRATEAGFQHFLVKPPDIDELLSILTGLTRRAQ